MSYNIEQINGGYLSLGAAGLAEGTNAAKFKTVNTIAYLINGVFKSLAGTDNLSFSAGHKAVPAASACLFGVFVDGAGNVSTTQGPIVGSADNCPVPPVAGGAALIGLIKVVTDGSTTFTPGTTDLGASGVTDSYLDCALMPGSAQ